MSKPIPIFILFITMLYHFVGFSQNLQKPNRNDNEGFYLLKNADLYFSKGKLLVAKEIYIDNIQFLNEQQKINLSSILVMNQESEFERSLAFKLVKSISDQNNPTVKAFLGKIYLLGIGTHRDSLKGAILLNESITGNSQEGYYWQAYALREKGDYSQSFNFLKHAADMGHVMAMNDLGYVYHLGIGKPVNYDSAIYWYKKAATLGNGLAYANIGFMYYSGVGVEKDYKKAFEYLNLSNNNGNINYTQLNTIGLCYLNGKGVEANADSAYYYFHAAAVHGYPSGYTNIGVLYEFFKGSDKKMRDSAVYFYGLGGRNGDKDAYSHVGSLFLKEATSNPRLYEVAGQFFKMGAKLGNTNCMTQYADLIKMGKVVEEDSFRYIQLLQRASLLGDSEADNLLAIEYENLNNLAKSEEYLKLGASRNNYNALLNYAILLRRRNPSDPLIQEYLTKAVKMGKPYNIVTIYEKFPEYKTSLDPYAKSVFDEVRNAALSGNLNSRKILSSFYFSGIGTQKDEEKAIQNRIEIFNLDSLNAYSIALLFMNKSTPDYINAFKWASLAEEKKDDQYSEVTANLAFLYANGFGVKKDSLKAMEYYLKSADAGNVESMGTLGIEYSPWGHLSKVDSTKAFYWMQKSAMLGNAISLNNLGECYYTGLGTEKNFEKARYYYQMSADRGEAIGKLSLGVLYLNGEGVKKDINKARQLFDESCKGGIPEGCEKLKDLK